MDLKTGETSINSANGASYMDSTERTESTPLQGVHHEHKGLRVIISCLTVMTAIVSVALGAQIYYGDNRMVHHGSIVTDSHDCSIIGKEIIQEGGNAVDAAVAGTLCMGVVHPHLTGIGGGGFMVIFDQRSGKPLNCIDFRPMKSISPAIGVPGFLSGLYHANVQFGKMKWADLVKPSAKLARSGFRISESLAGSSSLLNLNSSGNARLSEWLSSLKTGSVVSLTQLADTLDEVALYGSDVYYNGSFAVKLSEYVRSQDVKQYTPSLGSCQTATFEGYNFFVPGEGSGGPLLIHTLNQLNLSDPFTSPIFPALQELQGDKDFQSPFPSGVHVAAMDDNDIYVSIVSGIGEVLGSQVMMSDGYILNNALELGPLGVDNKPNSLAVPIVFVENNKICGNRYITGGNDVRDMIQLMVYLLFMNEDLQTSIEAPRARLSPTIGIEKNHSPSFPAKDLEMLKSVGYSVENAVFPYPSLNTIQKSSDDITSYADSRGQGEAITI